MRVTAMRIREFKFDKEQTLTIDDFKSSFQDLQEHSVSRDLDLTDYLFRNTKFFRFNCIENGLSREKRIYICGL